MLANTINMWYEFELYYDVKPFPRWLVRQVSTSFPVREKSAESPRAVIALSIAARVASSRSGSRWPEQSKVVLAMVRREKQK